MRLSIVFPLMNQFPLARTAIGHAIQNLSDGSDAELIIIDNGSDIPFLYPIQNERRQITIRHEQSIGVYPTFWDALPEVKGDIIAFFHSDLIITEKDWDKRVLESFQDPKQVLSRKLGLLGFIGSNEIDGLGGRGLGTTSNFQGDTFTDRDGLGSEKVWKGSPAYVHGRVSAAYSRAVVVDGCAMIFRKSVLQVIKQRQNFPPHHFYDRLLSSEVRELKHEVGVLGIACDHISGQTVAHEPKYELMAEAWCNAHGLQKGDNHNWDSVLYKEAERQWLTEYRDQKKLIPYRV